MFNVTHVLSVCKAFYTVHHQMFTELIKVINLRDSPSGRDGKNYAHIHFGDAKHTC